MTTTQANSIYQIKITLTGVRPPIWRTVLVPGDLGLDSFHQVIQAAMGWEDCHLHQFFADKVCYGMADEDFGLEMEDETRHTLSQLLKNEKDALVYEYDFGDSWEHKILLEKILPHDDKKTLPVCIKGKRACPPEDCGGIWGYQELLETLSDSKHPDHEDMLEWLGGEFDPEAFDLDEINRKLSRCLR